MGQHSKLRFEQVFPKEKVQPWASKGRSHFSIHPCCPCKECHWKLKLLVEDPVYWYIYIYFFYIYIFIYILIYHDISIVFAMSGPLLHIFRAVIARIPPVKWWGMVGVWACAFQYLTQISEAAGSCKQTLAMILPSDCHNLNPPNSLSQLLETGINL